MAEEGFDLEVVPTLDDLTWHKRHARNALVGHDFSLAETDGLNPPKLSAPSSLMSQL